MKIIATTLVIFSFAVIQTAMAAEKTVTKTSKSTDSQSDSQRDSQSDFQSDSSEASASISSSNSDGKGKVSYNKKEVWKGKVRKQLFALAKSDDGKQCAAAFDGKKVVWELNKGDGKKLEPELKKLLKKLPKN